MSTIAQQNRSVGPGHSDADGLFRKGCSIGADRIIPSRTAAPATTESRGTRTAVDCNQTTKGVARTARDVPMNEMQNPNCMEPGSNIASAPVRHGFIPPPKNDSPLAVWVCDAVRDGWYPGYWTGSKLKIINENGKLEVLDTIWVTHSISLDGMQRPPKNETDSVWWNRDDMRRELIKEINDG